MRSIGRKGSFGEFVPAAPAGGAPGNLPGVPTRELGVFALLLRALPVELRLRLRLRPLAGRGLFVGVFPCSGILPVVCRLELGCCCLWS